jgi:hypothetical protein
VHSCERGIALFRMILEQHEINLTQWEQRSDFSRGFNLKKTTPSLSDKIIVFAKFQKKKKIDIFTFRQK